MGDHIELGGGHNPKIGYTNLDIVDTADIQINFDTMNLPLEDASVEKVYSSHCFEHLKNLKRILNEICRVCKLGAIFELRVPHWLSCMAMCQGHICTISPVQVRHWVKDFPQDWFDGPKRLYLNDTKFVPGENYTRARELYRNHSDLDLFEMVPNTCHEIAYFFSVIKNERYVG